MLLEIQGSRGEGGGNVVERCVLLIEIKVRDKEQLYGEDEVINFVF